MPIVTPTLALRPYYLDASVLVKLVVDELESAAARTYVFSPDRSWRICTSFCFIEAFGALKLKNKRRGLSDNGYVVGCRKLLRLVQEEKVKMIEVTMSSSSTLAECERLVSAYTIDFLDAFQLVSVKSSWPQLATPSQPILVTADGDLAKAAEREGIEYWLCRNTP